MGRGLRFGAAIATVGAFGLLVPPPAMGAAKTKCNFTSTITLQPGFSLVPSTGTFSSGGETGTVTCDGPVRGIVPTGPGTLGVEGRYGTRDPDTCFGGEGEGRFSFTFPTAIGPGKRSNVFTFTFSLIGLSGSGFSGDGFGGGFDEVQPEEGDCVVHPVTKIVVKGHGTIERQ